MLFDAEYPATIGSTVTPATPEQLGRLRAILEDVAGLLRGESDGVLLSQFDANATNAVGATYSDNVVNTQRGGVDQRYYLTIPADVQQGTFQLEISPEPGTATPIDQPGLPPLGFVDTGVINMPSVVAASPGGAIDINKTMQNIATAINAVLGNVWPNAGITENGSVAVREVGEGPVAEITVNNNVRTFTQVPNIEVDARNGTEWQIPTVVTDAELPVVPIQPPNALSGPGEAFIIELIFQGRCQRRSARIERDQCQRPAMDWDAHGQQQHHHVQLCTGRASPVVATPGDFTGNQGPSQYNAALAMSAAGNMVAAYTDQALQTDGITIPTDAAGNSVYSNIYYERLAESTDTVGPQIVGWDLGQRRRSAAETDRHCKRNRRQLPVLRAHFR